MKPDNNTLLAISEKWKLSKELEFIRKVENWIYKDCSNRLFIRITEPSHRSLNQINSELDWMFFLGSQKIEIAHPVLSESGNLVESISSDQGTFYVCVFKEAKGYELKNKSDFTPKRLMNWGRLIGNLHTATINYTVKPGFEKRPEWNFERNDSNIKYLCVDEPMLYRNFLKIEEWLDKLPKDKTVYNLIHADIHHGNFFVDEGDRMTLFDFDDCLYHWFAYDLAVPLFTLSIAMRNKCSENELKDMFSSFIKGYKETSSLDSKWLDKIEMFILYRHFVIYLWAKKNLESNDLSENAKDWILMALEFCKKYISNFDYKSIEEKN